MKIHRRFWVLVFLLSGLSGCSDAVPTTPSPAPIVPPPNPRTGAFLALEDQTFEVSGIVTGERGAPLANVKVTMRFYIGAHMGFPSVQTDSSGAYRMEFTSTPYALGSNGNRAAARAEVTADGYDWYYRDVIAAGPRLVENFSLQRVKQIVAGSAIVLSLTDANALCLGWLYSPCDRVLVSVPAAGTLTVAADPKDATAERPQIQVCCVNGDERIGNPVTIPVEAGRVDVEVGQPQPPGRKTESATVRTSFEPS